MASPARPTLKPWLPKLWRDPDTLQIGVDPLSGVLLCGLHPGAASWLSALDGSRTEAELLAEAAAIGLDLATAVQILAGLRRAGVLMPAGAECPGVVGPLLPELVNLIDAQATSAHPRRTLDARGRRHVVIDGANRIGVPLGAMLAASGIGRLSFLDAASVRRCDAGVGGLSLDDEGEPRIVAAYRAIRRISPVDQGLSQAGPQQADLTILCQPWTAHDPLQAGGPTGRGAHLAVAVREGTVVIGPLVLPGRTSCLHCAQLHRTDRDPRWPTVSAQLVAAPHRAVHEPTSVLATLAAALAAGQVLDHLDGARAPEVLNATLELRPPDWRLQRRGWPAHADCGCISVACEPAEAG